MRIYVRYELPDEHGKTRRERNADFGVADKSPPLEIPGAGRHIWDWYHELSSTLMRVIDGVTYKIPPSEYRAWAEMMGHIVNPDEYGIMMAMDRVFCGETAKEVEAYREREAERRKRESKG